VDSDPLQPPEAVHEVAFVVLQASVEPAPLCTLAGLALSVTVGAAGGGGGAVTVTVAVAAAGVVPLAPEQSSV
jgi:hypothetical protein